MSTKIFSHISFDQTATGFCAAVSAPLWLIAAIAKGIQRRRELNQLLSLPDYMLKDVGIQRDEIVRQSMKPLWSDLDP